MELCESISSCLSPIPGEFKSMKMNDSEKTSAFIKILTSAEQTWDAHFRTKSRQECWTNWSDQTDSMLGA